MFRKRITSEGLDFDLVQVDEWRWYRLSKSTDGLELLEDAPSAEDGPEIEDEG